MCKKMNEEGEIELTVDGIDYTVLEEGTGCFTIMDGEENFAEVCLSECSEYYIYNYYPMYASLDNCSGQSHINDHEGILDFFRWVIGACQ